jgi:hypothetical protein
MRSTLSTGGVNIECDRDADIETLSETSSTAIRLVAVTVECECWNRCDGESRCCGFGICLCNSLSDLRGRRCNSDSRPADPSAKKGR